MYIDGDTHYWPLRFIDKVSHPGRGRVEVREDRGDFYIRFGERVPGNIATYYRDGKKVHSFKEGRWSLPLRTEFMKRDGFDVQVLIPDNRPLIYELEHDLGVQLARAYNDTTAEDIKGDKRFIGVAWIYLPDIDEAIRELRRAVKDLGMRAVKFNGGYADGDLDSEALWPLYEEIERLDIPILVHPAARVFEAQHSHPWLVGSERYQGFPHFPTALGFPLTYMVSAARLIFSGVLDRFPALKFAFFEGGVGWVPWLMQTLDQHTPGEATISVAVHQFFDGGGRIKKAPSRYFDQFFIAAVAWEKYLPEIVEVWPDHNIIIGSDFDHGDAVATWPRTVSVIKNMPGLSERDKDKILGANAMRLFGLEPNGS
ncbi:MAG TPA: amidohydrolase family protein [Candidatus Eisenbacteria bacterium]|nr:amidohydrolase family protein [Candidatus Eisenbacteria bacterium]